MKKAGSFFIWIILLAAALLLIITIAQLITQKSISRIGQGNSQAAITMTMNNRLQEMVNLSFELESKMLSKKTADLVFSKQGLKDSLTRLEYNITVLEKSWYDTAKVSTFKRLLKFVNNQVNVSFAILQATENKNAAVREKMTDSLRQSHWGDSIYASAITFQKGLEQNLNATITQNSNAASQLSLLNRLLAGVALLAILVLATIIIRRQVKQLSLIKDLEEARKVALASAEAKDQFLANMSHEIRTPLNAIKGFGRVLLQTPLDKDQQKYASIISTASENLLNIVNDILDFSRIEGGNLVMKKKIFQLNQALNELEMMFTRLAQEKELQLIFSIDPRLPELIKSDPERLRQILVNLLSNAIKFTNTGNVTLSVQLAAERGNRIKARFLVTDTGVGIPPEKIDVIFERFEQLDHSFTRQQGGTGLGLAITKKLVEAMGGSIHVRSEINKGSEFDVELEFEKIIQRTAEKEALLAAHTAEKTSLSNIRVLVAEDNKMNQLLVKSILEKYQVETEIVENGEELLSVIRQKKFDLILMDVQMPKVDGITATRLLRNDFDATIPVIAMTAHVLPGEREKCIDAGMNDYLTKPLDEEEVITMLKKYLTLHQKDSKPLSGPVDHNWLNMGYLNSICGNNDSRVLFILNALGRQLPLEIITLENCLETNEPADLKKACHYLKSTLSPFSIAAPPVILLGELNRLLTENAGMDSATEKVKQLISELNNACGMLKNFIAISGIKT
jgi:signal transduction histidine kinase/CheY-like chemotaxis protein